MCFFVFVNLAPAPEDRSRLDSCSHKTQMCIWGTLFGKWDCSVEAGGGGVVMRLIYGGLG